MDTISITAIVTWIASAAKFLKGTGADDLVKSGSKSIFSWLKEKFTKKSELEKIKVIEDAPDNDAAIKALEQMIADLQKDDAALFSSLQEQIKLFSKTVSEKMPIAASTIDNQIIKSKNVVVDSFKNVSSQGNISINVGDNHAK